ncbi:MAG: glycosyltransferase family A protein [Chloroflexota bacterium]
MPELTVVLISKNQEWNIARLIESVLEQTSSVESCEIILVDSASTDQTTEIASQYPITVLKLSADQHLGPAAGRYVGYKHTSGKFVLFLDGDNEMYPGWFEKGWNVLKNEPNYAVVTGPRVPLLTKATDKDKPALIDPPVSDAEDAVHSGGTAMFRRDVLEKVGTFNPYLYSDEEPELAVRIRHAGYRIKYLAHPIAYDYTDPIDEIPTKIARWKRNLYLGAGQNLRYHLGTETFWMYLRERGFGIIPLFGALVGLGAFIGGVISGNFLLIGLWSLVLILFIIFDMIRKRSWYLATVSLVHRLLILDGTVRGFIKKPLAPTSYPGKHEVVRGSK